MKSLGTFAGVVLALMLALPANAQAPGGGNVVDGRLVLNLTSAAASRDQLSNRARTETEARAASPQKAGLIVTQSAGRRLSPFIAPLSITGASRDADRGTATAALAAADDALDGAPNSAIGGSSALVTIASANESIAVSPG
jgi:hypothetical protein